MHALLAFAATTCLCALALYVHTRVRGFLPEDAPAPGRKRHPRPTPMLGAAPAAVMVILAALDSSFGLATGLSIACATGLCDDVIKSRDGDGIRARTKAAGQSLALLAVLTDLWDPGTAATTLLLAGLLLFVLTNAVNFLDNQNGVATTLGVVGLGFTPLIPFDLDATATSMAAAWLAFLPWNWPRARAFSGDQGALTLGLALGAMAIRPAPEAPLAPDLHWLAPAAVPLLDFVQVVSARLYLGYAPWIGDRRHLTHVLLVVGLPPWSLAPVLSCVAALLAWSMRWLATSG